MINRAVCELYIFVIKTENGARSILSPLKSLLSSQEPGLLQNCSGGVLSILQWFKGEVVLWSFFFPIKTSVFLCVFTFYLFLVLSSQSSTSIIHSRREALFTASGALCLHAMQVRPPAQVRGTPVLRSFILQSLTEMTHLRGQDPDAGKD